MKLPVVAVPKHIKIEPRSSRVLDLREWGNGFEGVIL